MKRILIYLSHIVLAILLFSPFPSFAADKKITQEDVDRFSRALSEVYQSYVEEVAEQKILENAIEGMLSGLDPHSEYLNKEDLKRLIENAKGEFAGIGIELSADNGLLKVITPLDGTPAAKAGIKPGDLIVEIGDKAVESMSTDNAMKLIRGAKDSSVTITVLRKNSPKPILFTIKRDTIKIDSVKSKLLYKNYGYVRITQFQKTTGDQLKEAITTLQKRAGGKLHGLVLDLRNNPGGLLDVAVQVTNMFLYSSKLTDFDKKIVYAKGRAPNAAMEARADSVDVLDSAPLVILINSGSASASEIVAGALQDYHRALIVGEKSFGKGSVQTIIPLDKEHAIKLTTALYYTPSGRVIQAKGIEPDIFVENLKLKKDSDETTVLLPMREENLSNHLSGDALNTTDKYNQKNDDGLTLLLTDYQLNESLNLLKAINAVNQKIVEELKKI